MGGASSLNFNFLDDEDEGTETLAGTTEQAEEQASTLEPLAFMNITHNLPGRSSFGKTETSRKKFLRESPRRRRKEGAARVPFLGTQQEEE